MPSLASKIKDAMQNLMASMKPQNNGQSQQQQGGKNSGQDKSQQAKAGQKSAAGQGQKKSGEQTAESQEGESDDDSDSGKSADGKSSGKSSDQQGNHNPGSGIGKQDGAKDAHLAEQLAAMGKISEIIGKRSANVSGEVTVEVNSSKQQIRTQYSESKATPRRIGRRGQPRRSAAGAATVRRAIFRAGEETGRVRRKGRRSPRPVRIRLAQVQRAPLREFRTALSSDQLSSHAARIRSERAVAGIYSQGRFGTPRSRSSTRS